MELSVAGNPASEQARYCSALLLLPDRGEPKWWPNGTEWCCAARPCPHRGTQVCVTSGLVPNEKARAPALQVNARRHGRVLEKRPLARPCSPGVTLPAGAAVFSPLLNGRAGNPGSLEAALTWVPDE